LALGDRVVWIGKDKEGAEPAKLGTVIRITAHAIEVRWDSGAGTRCRRAHLYHLRRLNAAESVAGDYQAA